MVPIVTVKNNTDAGSQTSTAGSSESSGEEEEFSDESKGSGCELVINGEEIR